MVGKKVVAVAAGLSHTAVVTDTGELWTFGENDCNKLGLGEAAYRCTQFLAQRVQFPFTSLL